MIRPLIWPHVVLPIVPDSLRELLEAPVPLLIGMPAPAPALRKSFKNIVWVMLDEPSPKRRLQPSDQILLEVKEMYGDGLKQKIMYQYNDFGQSGIVYQPSERQVASIRGVTKLIKDYLTNVLKCLPKYSGSGMIDSQKLVQNVAPKFNTADHLFLRCFLSTQLVVTHIESTGN